MPARNATSLHFLSQTLTDDDEHDDVNGIYSAP